ncbi:hypothetical protein J7M23_12890 [Candidatus Sumerlaeota bacterium]|nr:hypothetical protein [Candidatus Sumerlaeota bacterium]
MNLAEKILTLDRRWIYLGIAIIAIAFYIHPVPLPIGVSPQTQAFYDAIESVKPGEIVHLTVDYSPGGMPELFPMTKAVIRRLFEKDVKIVASTLWPEGVPITERAFKEVLEQLSAEGIHKEYGIDYVNLGYKVGQDAVMTRLGTSFKATYPEDARGTKVEDIPLMQEFDNFDGIALMVNFSVGVPGIRQWIQQVQMRYHVKIVCGATGVMSPDLYAFFQSKQLKGFLGGLVGAAEYEKLINFPGKATSGMTIQSFLHLFIVLLVLIGNGAYFFSRRQKKSPGAG